MWSNTWLWGDPKKVKLKETYEISKHTIPCILNIALRACQIYVKIHFSWKLIMGSEKMEPFDELSIGNISDFHLEPSNLHFFQFLKFQNPFISPKKDSSDWNLGFNPKIGFEKYAPGPEILAKTSKIMQVWFGDLIFGTFCFRPVVLSTMNPTIRRILYSDL